MNEGERILEQIADELLTLDGIVEESRDLSWELHDADLKDIKIDGVLQDERFLRVDVDETKCFVEENKAKATVYKTKSDMKVFYDWANSVNESRLAETILAEELDNLLARFYLAVRKRDGSEYEPDTITGIQNSIDRYLKDRGITFSIKRDCTFSHSNRVLEAKRKHLKSLGKGNKGNRAEPLSKEEIQKMQEKGLLGCDNPKQLLYTVWLNNAVFFGLRGRQDHVNLQWGDIQLKKTTGKEEREYLEFNERRTKTRSGAKKTDMRDVTPKMFERKGDPFCPVKTYKIYRDRRPKSQLEQSSRFYLQNIKSPASEVWFSNQPVGKDKLGKMMNVLAEKGEIEGRKVNHSTRKTFATTLVHGGRAPTEIAQLAGWKNVQTVNEYSKPSIDQQAETSDMLADVVLPKSNSIVEINEDKSMEICATENKENSVLLNDYNYTNRQNSNPYAILCGSTITGGVFNISVYSGKRKHVSLSGSSQDSE